MSSRTEMHERSLVKRCLSGERQAWDEFFESHYKIIFSIVRWRKWGFDVHEHEDVKQEVIEEIIKSLRAFKFQSLLSTFVYKIAVNTCIRRLRHKQTLKRGSDAEWVSLDHTGGDEHEHEHESHVPISRQKNQEEVLLDQEKIHWVKKALGSLNKRCKDLIRSRYFEELSFQEIARKLKSRENTLVVQLRRCLQRLAQYVQAEAKIG